MPAHPLCPPPPTGRSPWAGPAAALAQVRRPPGPVDLRLRVPGSKSLSNRLLLLAAVARGDSQLGQLLRSDDVYWTVQVLRRLGVPLCLREEPAQAALHLRLRGAGAFAPLGGGGYGPRFAVPRPLPLFVGDAGTLGRFLPGLLLCGAGGPYQVDGSAQLRRRPLAPLLRALAGLFPGALQGAGLPLRLHGQGERRAARRGAPAPALLLDGSVSSQFASALLMLGPLLPRGLQLGCVGRQVQAGYLDLTAACMRQFGARLARDSAGRRWQVEPGGYRGTAVRAEADLSTAAYFWAAALLCGGRVEVEGVRADSLQPDRAFLALLSRLGAQVCETATGVRVSAPARLRGGGTLDLGAFGDQAPTVAVLASQAQLPVHLTGIAHLRHHESDRPAALVAALRALGGRAELTPHGLRILAAPCRGGTVDSRGDHRIAMAASLFAARLPQVCVTDPGCVAKTCPHYFRLLQAVGFDVKLMGKI